MPTINNLEYITIAIYLLLMMGVGAAFKRFTKNSGDFFKSGSRGTWWLVGTSLYMSGFSAWAFTGAAGVAYLAGWSVLCGFAGQAAGYFVNYFCYARWFRQLRATTGPEVIDLRFGPRTRQFYAWTTIVTSTPVAALQLYALAIFCASVFNLDIAFTILFTGAVVVAYTIIGGTWSLMATDFIQTLILIPMTVALAVVCLIKLGGFDGMLEHVRASGLTDSFQLFKPEGAFPNSAYTWAWGAALFLRNLMQEISLASASRYFAVKDGRDAAKAAMLCCVLLTFGLFIWFIPPMTARLLYEAEVRAVGAALAKPAEAAYVVAGLKLLPAGFTGIMVIAMFAATMSGMDAGLTRNAAVIVRDICPSLCRIFGFRAPGEAWQLQAGRWVTLVLGVGVVWCAFYFSRVKGVGIFELMTQTGALLALPMSIPMILAVFIRRVPSWSAIFSVGLGLLASLVSYNSRRLFGQEWNLQTTIFVNVAVGVLAFLATIPFWRSASKAYRDKVDAFFDLMHRPVDFEREVGRASDPDQLRLLGYFTMATGALFQALLVVPNPMPSRILIVSIGFSIIAMGGGMVLSARRAARLALARTIPSGEKADLG